MRSPRRQRLMRSRLVVALLTAMFAPIWSTGSARSIWVSVLRGPAEHQCSCSLSPGHHCHCPKCLEEALREHEPSENPEWRDSDCDDDDHETGPRLVAQLKVLLPAANDSLMERPPRRADESPPPVSESREPSPPETPPPNLYSA